MGVVVASIVSPPTLADVELQSCLDTIKTRGIRMIRLFLVRDAVEYGRSLSPIPLLPVVVPGLSASLQLWSYTLVTMKYSFYFLFVDSHG